MGTGIQTCDTINGEANLHLHQRETCEASDILIIPKMLENDDDSKTRSQGMENGVHASPSLTATQQAVILAYCLLIEKSSRQDELQRKLPFVHALMILCLACAYLHMITFFNLLILKLPLLLD